jgi:anthranilate/para-aminobenzoate synthase component I
VKDAGCRVKKLPRRFKRAHSGKALIVKLQIGAGIVAGSRPDREYVETAKN